MYINYVDIWWAILSGGRFIELRPTYQGCRALTFALARLSCFMLLTYRPNQFIEVKTDSCVKNKSCIVVLVSSHFE